MHSPHTIAAHAPTANLAPVVEVLMLSKYDASKFIDKKVQDLMNSYADKFYLDEASIRRCRAPAVATLPMRSLPVNREPTAS